MFAARIRHGVGRGGEAPEDSVSSGMVLAAEAATGASAWLTQVVALLCAGAGIAYLCQRLGIVPIVGFLLAGALIGPNALRLVNNAEVVDAAAEIGVVLLLFTIGLEFSIGRLMAIRRLIFLGGGLQVVLATAVTAGVVLLAGQEWRAGVYTGFLVALSSTAIVLKLNADRGVTATRAGQVTLGLLLFQDLAVVVMVLLVPMLGGAGGSGLEIARALGVATLLIVLVLVVARRLLPPVLEVIARACSPEVFLLAVAAICLGTAYLTSLLGVSLSLGAFLAGLVVSESRFSEHAFGEILPLQILFSATFFVSVGMLLDPGFLVANLPLVLAVVGAVVVVKVLTTGASVLALGLPPQVAAMSALTLAQVGEFSFVLERVGAGVGLMPAGLGDQGAQTFVAASVLLMVATPLLARAGDGLARRLPARRAVDALASETAPDAQAATTLADHAVVAGYGQAARTIVTVLDASGIPHVVTTLSPGGADEAEAGGHQVVRGDAARQRTLLQAGMDRARVLVVADDDPEVAQRIARIGRSLNPVAGIIVRTRHNTEADRLLATGADHVVTEEHASAAAVTEKVLRRFDLPEEEIREQILRLWHARAQGTGGAVEAVADGALAARARRLSAFGTVVDTERTVTLATNGGGCSHASTVRPVVPGAPGCEECLERGDRWVHLRICTVCGHVGCCDESPNRHATAHHHRTRHPIIRSGEPGEEWGWCYVDRVLLGA